MVFSSLVEHFLKHQQLAIIASLIGVTTISWCYLIILAVDMHGMMVAPMSDMTQLKPWAIIDAVLMFVMWTVMMIGMMVPSASPTILLYARVFKKRKKDNQVFVPTGAFLIGYLTIWSVFSAVATLLQWGLEQAALLSPMMVSTSPLLGGLILIAAGIYQLTPFKSSCLKHCRSPVEFLSHHWRNGTWGAFVMGLDHGLYCLGCCWTLMILLFVVGVMNLLGVAAIAIFVLLEKVTRFGRLISGIGALLLLSWGIVLLTTNTQPI